MIMAWLMLGDCVEQLRNVPDGVVDAVVTDPPHGLSFMGKKWDYDVPSVDVWAECLRVLKPGGHLLAFAGTRTQHRMAVRIEDAGFEIRDMIAWVYGSGFPKSLDVSRAIDKAAGAERDVVGRYKPPGMDKPWNLQNARDERGVEVFASSRNNLDITAPATDAARQWQGWGTALKPALEPITVARKPFPGTVADNVQAYRTGALNIDGCRVHADDALEGRKRPGGGIAENHSSYVLPDSDHASPAGRWPANLIHDGSPDVLAGFPDTKARGNVTAKTQDRDKNTAVPYASATRIEKGDPGDAGSAARFFYCAKASKADRNAGCDDLPEQFPASAEFRPNHMDKALTGEDGNPNGRWSPVKNNHPTVKPTDLMRYLCRLVTPPGGVVLDPFMGSGSTGRAAGLEGFQFIGVERDPGYFEIAKRRVGA